MRDLSQGVKQAEKELPLTSASLSCRQHWQQRSRGPAAFPSHRAVPRCHRCRGRPSARALASTCPL